MNDLLIYALKVNGSIILFYLFYMLFYRRDTFWKIRRTYLLITLLFSFLYPLIQFGEWFGNEKTIQVFASAVSLNEVVISVKPAVATVFTAENILWTVYALFAFALLFKIITQIISILIKWRKGEKTEYNGTKLIHLNENITPFSFFSLIFINKNLHTPEELPEILTHELSHVCQRHSYDVILSEITTALCWFNPFAWLLKKELKQNLEFLADNHVINVGFEAKKYQYLLLNISCNYVDNQLINQFNISPIKKRIIMMNKQKTSGKGLIKYTLIIPVALTMLIISNAQNINAAKNLIAEVQQKKTTAPSAKVQVTPVEKAKKLTPKPDANGLYHVVETPPKFPGGEAELMKYISNNIKYPVKAQEVGAMGRVIVKFIVDKEGNVTKPEVIKTIMTKTQPEISVTGYDKKGDNKGNKTKVSAEDIEAGKKSIENEALRVVKAMPVWTPGKNKGENVNVAFFIPINFKLQ